MVICDITGVSEKSGVTWTLPGYGRREPNSISISEFMLSSLDQAYVWNKLYHRRLFNIIRFPGIWYEDIATVPVLISYARRIHYLPVPLYFYIQRNDSVTSQMQNVKNLEVIEAWRFCLSQTNKVYQDEVAYAVYYSIVDFLRFRWRYHSAYFNFFFTNIDVFKNNRFIMREIRKRKAINLFCEKRISRIICYWRLVIESIIKQIIKVIIYDCTPSCFNNWYQSLIKKPREYLRSPEY
jgi:hypothetical protein